MYATPTKRAKMVIATDVTTVTYGMYVPIMGDVTEGCELQFNLMGVAQSTRPLKTTKDEDMSVGVITLLDFTDLTFDEVVMTIDGRHSWVFKLDAPTTHESGSLVTMAFIVNTSMRAKRILKTATRLPDRDQSIVATLTTKEGHSTVVTGHYTSNTDDAELLLSKMVDSTEEIWLRFGNTNLVLETDTDCSLVGYVRADYDLYGTVYLYRGTDQVGYFYLYLGDEHVYEHIRITFGEK